MKFQELQVALYVGEKILDEINKQIAKDYGIDIDEVENFRDQTIMDDEGYGINGKWKPI